MIDMANTNRKLLLIGAGGHCRSVLDCALSSKVYDDIGIINDERVTILDIPVVGSDGDLVPLFKKGWTDAFISVGSIGNTTTRRQLYEMIKRIGFSVPSIVDKTAAIARGTVIGEGSFVGKKAVINTGASLGCCAIINTGAIVEHDCVVGDFSHISPGAVLCGQVSVGSDTHIGAGSVIRQQISIGNNVLIGAGSVVLKDISDGITAYGNPCKVVKK